MSRLATLLATWFGSGYSPFAPGTAGTLATLPLVVALWWVGSWQLHAAAVVIIFCLGLWAARGAEARWGRKDPGQVVIDETAGTLATSLLLAPAYTSLSLRTALAHGLLGPEALSRLALLGAAFVLFRVADIIKPWPANALERLPGSLGIMADDLVAGLYANVVLQVGLWYALQHGWLTW